MPSPYYTRLTYPFPPSIQNRLDKCLSFGTTGIIELLPSGYIQKSPHPYESPYEQDISRRNLRREYEVYQRLPQGHDRLIKLIDFSKDGELILEYMPLGNLREYLRSRSSDINLSQRLQWCIDAAEAVDLCHSHNIIHCDIKPENFLLDSELRLRLVDFSGSSIDGKPPHVLENTRFFLPRSRYDELPCSVLTDLFALGSSIYEIITGRQPYSDLKDEEVEARYERREFPKVDGMSCGKVIAKCWRGEFHSAKAAQVALGVEMQQYNRPHLDYYPSQNPPPGQLIRDG